MEPLKVDRRNQYNLTSSNLTLPWLDLLQYHLVL